MKNYELKKLNYYFNYFLSVHLEKKQLITNEFSTGTGLGSYTIFKSFMGQSQWGF